MKLTIEILPINGQIICLQQFLLGKAKIAMMFKLNFFC